MVLVIKALLAPERPLCVFHRCSQGDPVPLLFHLRRTWITHFNTDYNQHQCSVQKAVCRSSIGRSENREKYASTRYRFPVFARSTRISPSLKSTFIRLRTTGRISKALNQPLLLCNQVGFGLNSRRLFCGRIARDFICQSFADIQSPITRVTSGEIIVDVATVQL